MSAPDSIRTTYARATAGSDREFERALADVIIAAIGEACLVTDTNAMCLRTGEIIAALATIMACTLALTPERSPTAMRKAVESIARDIRRKANGAIADPDVNAFFARDFGNDDVGGHA
jgi:hypothetical protein